MESPQEVLENYQNKRVLIMGLGLQGGGVASAIHFAKQGAIVTVTDLKSEEVLKDSITALDAFPIRFVLGKHEEADFKNSDLILVNPGVPLNSHFLTIAKDHHIPIEMAESLFMKLCRVDVIGVTGTRGKSTTTHMIAHMLKKAGFDVLIGGNIPNHSALSFLDQITGTTKVVLELSSFQLAFFHEVKKSPHIAVFTNIYPDHLNRYKDNEEYFYDKSAIFAYQSEKDFLVYNSENEYVAEHVKDAKSQKVPFSKGDVTFQLAIPGEHNRENAAATAAVGKILNIADATIESALKTFHGLPYRLENLGSIDEVTIINDSASTTPTATIKALDVMHTPVVLMAGGNSKNLPIEEMVKKIKETCKCVILLDGTGTKEFKELLEKNGVSVIGPFETLSKTFEEAYKKAEKGDTILFSPGYTSFALFNNEFDRGEQFRNVVKKQI